MKEQDYEFLLEYFTPTEIIKRFRTLLTETMAAAKAMKIDDCIDIDREGMEMMVLDYFSDIARVKHFHNIEHENRQKIYAYEMFWFLRRHPVQICKPFTNSFDINEKIAIAIFVPKILQDVGMVYSGMSQPCKDVVNSFINNIFYHFKHRIYTQQSLELMIEAFLAGYECRSAQLQE
jgi:hypothetical protein